MLTGIDIFNSEDLFNLDLDNNLDPDQCNMLRRSQSIKRKITSQTHSKS